MRNLLTKMGKKSFRPAGAAGLMLNTNNPQTIKIVRSAWWMWPCPLQRLGNEVLKLAARKQTSAPPRRLAKHR